MPSYDSNINCNFNNSSLNDVTKLVTHHLFQIASGGISTSGPDDDLNRTQRNSLVIGVAKSVYATPAQSTLATIVSSLMRWQFVPNDVMQ